MRNYKRTSDRGTKSVKLMQRAADLVINENKSLRQGCRDYELIKTSLSGFIERMKNDLVNLRFGYSTPWEIFNKQQEVRFTEYSLHFAQHFHGISPKGHRIAYDCAIKYKMSVPGTWHINKNVSKNCKITYFNYDNSTKNLFKHDTKTN